VAAEINFQKMLETGASERQIHTWSTKEFLELSDRPEWAHQGIPRLWTLWAYKKAGLMVRLTKAGIPAAAASAFCEDEEVKADILNDCKWVSGKLAPGLHLRVDLREDWQ
jgi:hypothetical protein